MTVKYTIVFTITAFTSLLVMASNGGRSLPFTFPICSSALATPTLVSLTGSKSEALYGCQYVLSSSQLCGRLTTYFFLFKCLGMEFVLSLWGALSDERPGLSFVSHSLVENEVEVALRLTVSQYVLVSSTLVGLATRYYFLSECYCQSRVLLKTSRHGLHKKQRWSLLYLLAV
jgi:hypothetical protein